TKKRNSEIDEAFAWPESHDVVLALAYITDQKCRSTQVRYSALSPVEKVALNIVDLDGEMCNGGWHQFFTNSPGENWFDMLQSLKTIGAINTIRIFERALAVFPNSRPAQSQFERENQMQAVGPMAREQLNQLDQQYYAQSEDIFSL